MKNNPFGENDPLPLFRQEYSARPVHRKGAASMRERFHAYDRANPRVYELFKRFAHDAIRAGREHFAHWLIANRIRWEYYIGEGDPDFKLPNGLIAHYARKFIVEHPKYLGFFTIRKLKDARDEWPEIEKMAHDDKASSN